MLTARDKQRLQGVHPDLVRVVMALGDESDAPFMVIEGLRTYDRQKQLVAEGKSKTMQSRHLSGHAVDLAPLKGGQIDWKDKASFRRLRDQMFAIAERLGVKLRWGGDWNSNGSSADESFYDGPHFELPRSAYP
jgi:peptidoglycan L-alanyl-D-glutamate endopeptidase CwlK